VRVEIGYTYTKGGGFTLGRVFSAEKPPGVGKGRFPQVHTGSGWIGH